MMLTQSGFVISIALSIGLVTTRDGPAGAAVDLLRARRSASAGIDLRRSSTRSTSRSGSASSRASLGAVVSLMRGPHRSWDDPPPGPATAAR